MSQVHHLTSLEEFTELINTENLTVVDFSATWCGPCRFIAPKFEALSANPEYSGVNFAKVDIDEADEIADQFEIAGVPTFMFFKQGQTVAQFSGASEALLVKHLNQYQ